MAGGWVGLAGCLSPWPRARTQPGLRDYYHCWEDRGSGPSPEGSMQVGTRQAAHLREVAEFAQTLLYLQAPTIARNPIHHGHHGLLHHLTGDEALQHLGHLQALLGVLLAELLHLDGVRKQGSPVTPPPHQGFYGILFRHQQERTGALAPTCVATSLYTSWGRSEGVRLTEAAPALSRPSAA